MKQLAKDIQKWRPHLAQTRWLVLFGTIFLISQIVIASVLHPLGTDSLLWLQVSGFTVERYLETFGAWQSAGVMDFYHAHFVYDDIHWIWYSITLSLLLAHGLERHDAVGRINLIMLLPIIAGICDAIENNIQHIFLSSETFLTIVDPLPAISTLASIIKWVLAFYSIGMIIVLLTRSPSKAGK